MAVFRRFISPQVMLHFAIQNPDAMIHFQLDILCTVCYNFNNLNYREDYNGMKKILLATLSAVVALSLLMGTFVSCGTPEITDDNAETEAKYNEAISLVEDGKYEDAYAAFKALGDYKDAEKYLSRFIYFPTVVNYVLSDRSGVMTVTLGKFNLPSKIVSEGNIGTKESTYTYDDVGNLVKQEMAYDGDVMVYEYGYDAYNRHTSAVYYLNGEEMHTYSYIYNDLGQITKVTYEENGVLVDENTYEYDENGNIALCYYVADGETLYTYTYTYDENGNMTREHCADYTGGYYAIDYVYDTDGKLTHETYTDGGDPIVVDYIYDDAGNCIKEECTYPDGTSETLTREYDTNGNVTKEIRTSADGSVKSVETQYALNYLTIDVPESTMNNILSTLTLTTDY